MSNYILYPVLELKGYIILSVAVLCIMTAVVLFLMGRKRHGMEAFQWQAVFLGRTKRELVIMSLGISQIIFVLAMVFFFSPIGTVQLTALAVLCLVRGVLGLSVTAVISELVFGIMTGIGLMAGNLLLDYMNETGVDLYIFLIWALLSLFLILYSVYYFMKSLERMLQRHERIRRIQKEK